ncbi:MAG: hypothetical protein Tsb005_08290 [Gammaproteobacteria bacterium]
MTESDKRITPVKSEFELITQNNANHFNELHGLYDHLVSQIKQLQDVIPQAVCCLNEYWQIESLNPHAAHFLQVDIDQAIGKKIFDIIQLYNSAQLQEKLTPDLLLKYFEHQQSFHDESGVLINQAGHRTNIIYSLDPIMAYRQFKGAVWIFSEACDAHAGDAVSYVKQDNGLSAIDRELAQHVKQLAHYSAKFRYSAEYLLQHARRDPLTQLINRQYFEIQLQQAIQTSQQFNITHAMLYIDLDNFQVINDSSGHTLGDKFLQGLTQELSKLVRPQDVLARLGGDEFGILLMHNNAQQALALAERVLATITHYRFNWEGITLSLSASIGIVVINKALDSANDVLMQADTACFIAKEQGRNRSHVFEMNDSVVVQHNKQLWWVNAIHRAFDSNKFELYCQPIVPLADKAQKLTHIEVLIRMRDESGNMINPEQFLMAAENYHLMMRIDEWVVTRSCELLAAQPELHKSIKTWAINISAQSLVDEQFWLYVQAHFAKFNINPHIICFEITETAAIKSLEKAIGYMQKMHELGCQFALDDFGSGMSSFAYLKQLPVEIVKIDGLFIRDLLNDPVNYRLVQSVNEIVHIMGKKTVAEYVTTDAIKTALIKLGIDYAQGTAIAKALPIKSFIKQF